jgi:RNA polymerase sigma factor (sigma-70 family)
MRRHMQQRRRARVRAGISSAPDDAMTPPAPVPSSDREKLLRQLSERYRLPLTAYFARRVGSRAEAEDLTQEVFLRMVRRLELEDVENVEAFVFRTAVNLLRDRSRRDKSQSVRKVEFASRLTDVDDLSPERVFDSRQSLTQVIAVLEELDERTRDAFILHRLEGMKHAQIAELLGVSVSSVEKYVIKALTLLSKRTAGDA